MINCYTMISRWNFLQWFTNAVLRLTIWQYNWSRLYDAKMLHSSLSMFIGLIKVSLNKNDHEFDNNIAQWNHQKNDFSLITLPSCLLPLCGLVASLCPCHASDAKVEHSTSVYNSPFYFFLLGGGQGFLWKTGSVILNHGLLTLLWTLLIDLMIFSYLHTKTVQRQTLII